MIKKYEREDGNTCNDEVVNLVNVNVHVTLDQDYSTCTDKETMDDDVEATHVLTMCI